MIQIFQRSQMISLQSTMPARRAEPSCSTQCFVEILNLKYVGGHNALKDELGNTVPFVD